jgi:hypothetical protein
MQERPGLGVKLVFWLSPKSTPPWHSGWCQGGGNLFVPGDDLDCDGAGLAQVHRKGQVTVNRTLIAGAAVHTLLVAAVRDRNPKVGNCAANFVFKAQK